VSHWIADTLSRHSDGSVGIDAPQSGAAELVSNLSGCRAKRRLTIVAAGMQTVDGVTMPLITRLSNYEDLRTRFHEEEDHFIRNHFSVPLADNRVQYYVAGIPLNDEELTRVDEDLPNIVRNHGPNNVMKSLLRLQRRVAGRTNAVGQDAMVAVIPANPTAPIILTDLAGDDIHSDNTNYSYVRQHVFSTDRLFPLVADVGVVRELVGSTTPDGFDCIPDAGGAAA
jgi:hypothetical protein